MDHYKESNHDQKKVEVEVVPVDTMVNVIIGVLRGLTDDPLNPDLV